MEITAEDVIDPAHLETYKRERNLISEQLFFIANNLLIIEKIVEFPYHLFKDPTSHFWSFTSKAYFDSTILAFWTLLDDKGELPDSKAQGKRLTLRGLKSRVTYEYQRKDIDPTIRELLNRDIKAFGFQKLIEPFEKQIRAVRNHHIAHVQYSTKMQLEETFIEYKLPLEVLKSGLDICHKFFNILSLGTWYQLEEWDYAPRPYAENFYTDVDYLLAYCAKRSYWLRDRDAKYGQLNELQDEKFLELPKQDQQIILEWQKKIEKWDI
jgi:hypothetical protein